MIGGETMLKIAKVTQVDPARGAVKVMIPENGTESNWISILSTEYQMPEIGSMGMVLFDSRNYTEGLYLGEYFSDSNLPIAAGSGTYYKRMGKDAVLKYNTGTKTLEIFADQVTIHGNLTVEGTITAGKIEQGGGSG